MVTPVTGPFDSETNVYAGWPVSSASHISDRSFKRSYRQKRPYNLPLGRNVQRYRVTAFSKLPHYESWNSTGVQDPYGRPFTKAWSLLDFDKGPNLANAVRQQALKRFNDKVGQAAEMMVNIIQGRQALSMMVARATQLGRFFGAMRRLRFGDAYSALYDAWTNDQKRTLGPRVQTSFRKNTWRANAKYFSGNALELSFGWAPLLGDIHSSMEILSREFPTESLRGSATIRGSFTGSSGPQSGTNVYKLSCLVSATMKVENPNRLLLNQLGFDNPLIWLYEATPWSFVVNYVVNVEEYLKQFSSYQGVMLLNPMYSMKSDAKNTWAWPGFTSGASECFEHARVVGSLPGITLQVRPRVTMSPQRALTSVSLLLQKLGR